MSASPLVDRWIVLKFGGTSVSRRHRWDTIGKLAKKRAEETGSRVLVVVSALSGVTNELTAIADGAADSRDRVAALVARHRAFLTELELDATAMDVRLDALAGLLDDPRAAGRPLEWQAEVLGQGELLSSTVGAAYLRASGLDF
ncbi:MAG: bifunctional aspartate kinase/diaminopimelate decarboxylase, partial [Pseudoxanthomonas sp.]